MFIALGWPVIWLPGAFFLADEHIPAIIALGLGGIFVASALQYIIISEWHPLHLFKDES